jgi:hypothetical protein
MPLTKDNTYKVRLDFHQEGTSEGPNRRRQKTRITRGNPKLKEIFVSNSEHGVRRFTRRFGVDSVSFVDVAASSDSKRFEREALPTSRFCDERPD